MQLCLFHTWRTFRREFTSDKMDIFAGKHEHLLKLAMLNLKLHSYVGL